MKSIQSRLASGLFISLISIFFLLWYIVSSNIQQLAENYIASDLEHDLETLLTTIAINNDQLVINENRIDVIYQRPFSGHYFIIQHNDTLIRSRSLWDQNLVITEPRSSDTIIDYQPGPDQQSLLIMTRLYSKQNQKFIISIAEDITPVTKDIKQFSNYFGLAALVFLLTLITTQFIILRQQLKPLRRIQMELRQLEKGQINALTPDTSSEIKPVIDEINHLSKALHKRIRRSRDALSDLSHAIKKPLSVLQQLVESRPGSIEQKSLQVLQQKLDDIQHITDHVLKRARVAGINKPGRAFIINDDIKVLLQTIKSMYPNKSITAQINIENDLTVGLDREDLLELLGNLLDNAWKWAEHRVDISIQKTRVLTICIADDGRGVAEESLQQLTDRGTRFDESTAGHGIGLAIVADIVEDYAGQLNFQPSTTLGGLEVTVEIPLPH